MWNWQIDGNQLLGRLLKVFIVVLLIAAMFGLLRSFGFWMVFIFPVFFMFRRNRGGGADEREKAKRAPDMIIMEPEKPKRDPAAREPHYALGDDGEIVEVPTVEVPNEPDAPRRAARGDQHDYV